MEKFPQGEQAEILAIIQDPGIPREQASGYRLLRCALFASDRTLKGLRYQLDGLCYDYRDVILEAEYIRKKGKWIRVRDLSKPFHDSDL